MRKCLTIMITAVLGLATVCSIIGKPLGIDSSVYRAGALALLRGEPLYQPLSALPPWGIDLPFIYPPFAAMVFFPLAILPVALAWGVIAAGSATALWATVREYRGGVVVFVGVLVLDPVLACLSLGQINLLLMAAILLDVLRPSRYSGVLIGLAAAIKLTPLIFIAHLLLTGRRADAGRAALTFGAATALGTLCFPSQSRQFWLHTVFGPQPKTRLAENDNQSLFGLIARHFHGSAALYAIAVVLCLAIAAFLVRKLEDPPAAVLVTAACALLISPISWTNHWVWVIPLAAYLMRRKQWLLVAVVCCLFLFTNLYVEATLIAGIWLTARELLSRANRTQAVHP